MQIWSLCYWFLENYTLVGTLGNVHFQSLSFGKLQLWSLLIFHKQNGLVMFITKKIKPDPTNKAHSHQAQTKTPFDIKNGSNKVWPPPSPPHLACYPLPTLNPPPHLCYYYPYLVPLASNTIKTTFITLELLQVTYTWQKLISRQKPSNGWDRFQASKGPN